MYFLLFIALFISGVNCSWYELAMNNCTNLTIKEADLAIQIHGSETLYLWLSNYTIIGQCNYHLSLDSNTMMYYIIAGVMIFAILALLVTNAITYSRLVISRKTHETKRLYRTII